MNFSDQLSASLWFGEYLQGKKSQINCVDWFRIYFIDLLHFAEAARENLVERTLNCLVLVQAKAPAQHWQHLLELQSLKLLISQCFKDLHGSSGAELQEAGKD